MDLASEIENFEIEYLEKEGNPFSIKTQKQGRRISVNKISSDLGVTKKDKKTFDEVIAEARLTVFNIARHKLATPSQINSVKTILNSMEDFLDSEEEQNVFTTAGFYSKYNFIRRMGINLNKRK